MTSPHFIMHVDSSSRPVVNGAVLYDRVGIVLYLYASNPVVMDVIVLKIALH